MAAIAIDCWRPRNVSDVSTKANEKRSLLDACSANCHAFSNGQVSQLAIIHDSMFCCRRYELCVPAASSRYEL